MGILIEEYQYNGATSSNYSDAKKSDRQKVKKSVIEEFSLCDYYLIIGHRESFKVYPFIKKRGKTTDGVENCVYEYDEKKRRIEFTEDIVRNKQVLTENVKLQSILAFVAMFANISVSDVVNVRKLQEMSGSESKKTASLFEVFEMISKVYKKKWNEQPRNPR